MAELTSVAGLTTAAHAKSGASHAALMPTTVIFDPSLSSSLPDWVRFGTALRCVEHAVGAATHRGPPTPSAGLRCAGSRW